MNQYKNTIADVIKNRQKCSFELTFNDNPRNSYFYWKASKNLIDMRKYIEKENNEFRNYISDNSNQN